MQLQAYLLSSGSSSSGYSSHSSQTPSAATVPSNSIAKLRRPPPKPLLLRLRPLSLTTTTIQAALPSDSSRDKYNYEPSWLSGQRPRYVILLSASLSYLTLYSFSVPARALAPTIPEAVVHPNRRLRSGEGQRQHPHVVS